MVWPTPFFNDDFNLEKSKEDEEITMQLPPNVELTYMDHICSLNVTAKVNSLRLTGIFATIGPVSRSVEMLEKLMEKGMNIARINVSHGPHEYHAETFNNLETAVKNYSKRLGMTYPLAVALDTKGPEVRTGILDAGAFAEIELKRGATVKLTPDISFQDKCTDQVIFIDYENMLSAVKLGNYIYIDNGYIALVGREKSGNFLICTVEIGGMLGSKRAVNFPGVIVNLPIASERDKMDFDFGLERDVDMIFCSFIRSTEGVRFIQNHLGEKGRTIKIISKIENQEGLNNMCEIINYSGGIMVARGDLGIELPMEKMFLVQKSMIAACNLAGTPVCCGTQLLQSMMRKPRPTRAEVTDVANAVLDGADGILLVTETAKGDYPIQAMTITHQICKEAEMATWHRDVFQEMTKKVKPPIDLTHSVAISAVQTSTNCMAAAIIVISTMGRSARLISKYRPRCPIILVTRHAQTARQSQLYRAIVPILFEKPQLPDIDEELIAQENFALKFGKKFKIFKQGDPIILVHELKEDMMKKNLNKMTVFHLEEDLQSYSDSIFYVDF